MIMQANIFNTLLKDSEVEWNFSDEYTIYNEDNEEFYFTFNLASSLIIDMGKVELSEGQQIRIQKHITKWCNNKINEINNEKFDILNAPDDKENGIYGYGY